MNKNDWYLIIIVVLIFLLFMLFNKNGNNDKKAIVYYEDKVILEVKLDKKKEYIVKGYLGDITIETDVNKVRVLKEVSPMHLCSKQGYISNSNMPIICMPNKVVIKIVDDTKLDAVVG